jgi:hypothetical protein
VSADFSRKIEETHQRHYGAKRAGESITPPEPQLTLILCVIDDESAKDSLDYLSGISKLGHRVLCLFTRYARIDDVMRARRHGFAYYRWNGTTDNALVIARSIVGRSWAGVLNTGEKLSGDSKALTAFLYAQPANVTQVTLEGDAEPRFFHLRPDTETGSTISYPGLAISH